MMKEWIDVAATLGAERVRIVAGNQPPNSEVIARSSKHLNELIEYAKRKNVKVSTENWQKTSLEADNLLQILENCPELGLCVDVGNAEQTQDKYATLPKLLPHATSIHFKARYTNEGEIELADVQKCLELIQGAKFSGVMTLIYELKEREWEGLEQLRRAARVLV
jgi:sugar phosphate isomerase/epimerase